MSTDFPLPDGHAPADGVQVVVFRLGAELYACDVLRVEEVVTGERVHSLPDVPPPLLGVVRLRGALLPVVDVAPVLGLRLEDPHTPAVLVVEGAAGRMGIAVDEVREVATLPASAVQASPVRGAEEEEHVTGVARVGEELITLLDLAGVLGEKMNPSIRETP